MKDSIFTKIIKGEIPCHKIYEDDKTFAFLDIYPLMPGHVLVVSKLQIDQVDDLPEADYQAIFKTVQKVAKRVKEVFGTSRAIIQVLGYDVPHAHVHVIPSDASKPFFEAIAAHLQHDRMDAEPDHVALAKIAQQLAF
jgi:histidine triad (HIT) family protein